MNLTALPPPATSAWVCEGPKAAYGAEFLVRGMAPQARVAAVTAVETTDGKLHLSGQWQISVPHQGRAEFQLRVANWQGPPLKLETSDDLTIKPLPTSQGEQGWQIIVLQGALRRMQFKLTGVLPCQPKTKVTMPVFVLNNAVWAGHWIAVRTPGLEVQASAGLAAVKDISAEPGLPPGAAQRLGQRASIWKAAGKEWSLVLVTQSASAAPGLRMFAPSRKLAFGEGFGWIHQSKFNVQAQDGNELAVDMPAGAVVLGATVNDEQINPRFAAPDRLAVSLPSASGQHQLQLRWILGSEMEPLAYPQLAAPRLEGVPHALVNWVLTVPAGYRLADDENLPMDRGQQVRWQSDSQAIAPQPRLIAVERDWQRQTLIATCWLGFAGLGLLGLSLWPRALVWLQRLWPEQIGVVAVILWMAWGFDVLPAMLLLVAIAARLVLLRSHVRRGTSFTSQSTSSGSTPAAIGPARAAGRSG